MPSRTRTQRPGAEATRLLNAYLATRYRVRVPHAGSIFIEIGKRAPPVLQRILEEDQPFAILSACNPASQLLATAENRRRTRALVSRLRDGSITYLAATGSRGGWREPGVCIIGVQLPKLDKLAIDFGQNAIVIGCRGGATRLHVYRTDWHAMLTFDKPNGFDRIEWADASDGNAG